MHRVFNLVVLSVDTLFPLRLFLYLLVILNSGLFVRYLPRIKFVDVNSGVHQRENGYEVVENCRGTSRKDTRSL